MEMLTVKQAAELMQLQPRTIRQWIYDGKIKAVNIGTGDTGTRYRILKTELERFVDERMK